MDIIRNALRLVSVNAVSPLLGWFPALQKWGRKSSMRLSHPPGVNVIKLFSFVTDDKA